VANMTPQEIADEVAKLNPIELRELRGLLFGGEPPAAVTANNPKQPESPSGQVRQQETS
jgi:hypothetical protein